LSLDKDIPGQSTYNKPESDSRDSDRGTDTSIYDVDNADDLLKDQSHPDVNEDNADKHDGIGWSGGGKQDDSAKPKYPYREGHPEGLTASFVAHMFFMERAPVRVMTAARVEHIEQGLSRQIRDRAKKCRVTLKRVDAGNLRWIFAVDSGKGPKVVRLKATRLGKVVKLTKMDLHFACSCPSWQWQGPEYHAKQEGYIDGKPRGTASAPNVTDPERENRVCKHVAAVLDFVRKWEVPPPK
jgi:hypothetical protein